MSDAYYRFNLGHSITNQPHLYTYILIHLYTAYLTVSNHHKQPQNIKGGG